MPIISDCQFSSSFLEGHLLVCKISMPQDAKTDKINVAQVSPTSFSPIFIVPSGENRVLLYENPYGIASFLLAIRRHLAAITAVLKSGRVGITYL